MGNIVARIQKNCTKAVGLYNSRVPINKDTIPLSEPKAHNCEVT